MKIFFHRLTTKLGGGNSQIQPFILTDLAVLAIEVRFAITNVRLDPIFTFTSILAGGWLTLVTVYTQVHNTNTQLQWRRRQVKSHYEVFVFRSSYQRRRPRIPSDRETGTLLRNFRNFRVQQIWIWMMCVCVCVCVCVCDLQFSHHPRTPPWPPPCRRFPPYTPSPGCLCEASPPGRCCTCAGESAPCSLPAETKIQLLKSKHKTKRASETRKLFFKLPILAPC